MKLVFRTPVNRNGNSMHLEIDTDAKTFTRDAFGGIEIKRKDYHEIIRILQESDYVETRF